MKNKTSTKSLVRKSEVEVSQTLPKKSFFQKELKELTAGEIIIVIAITAVAIVAIITIRDIIRDILAAMVGMCALVALAAILVAAALGGSRN